MGQSMAGGESRETFTQYSTRENVKNWSADCAALHYGPLETAPLEGFDPPGAATALLLTVECVLVSTVFVFSFVPDLENTLLCTTVKTRFVT